MHAKEAAQLTAQQMTAGIVRLKKRLEDVEKFDPKTIIDQYSTPSLDALEVAIDEALARTFGAETLDYARYSQAKNFDRGPYNYLHKIPQNEFQSSISRSKLNSIALIEQAIKSLEERLREMEIYSVENATSSTKKTLYSNKVFVVHGHDDAVKHELARFLEKIELEAVILHEQPDQGRTIIEKFEDCASDVGFAVVILTQDDLASAKSDDIQRSRARQNVVFELGYFAGKLGRGKTCLIRKGDIELPSDLFGVIYTEFDPNEGWKTKLVKEMKAAGMSFDANKVWE